MPKRRWFSLLPILLTSSMIAGCAASDSQRTAQKKPADPNTKASSNGR